MRPTRFLFALAGIVLVALPAFGQLPTATLRGQVTTAENAPLPGVVVTVTSPALQGSRSATTEASGAYLIPLLPPGDYRVSFEIEGFATAERTIKLSAAQTSTLDQEMVLEGVTEEIVVTGTYETIAAAGQAATTYNYKEVIEKLPVNRDIRQAVLLTPGVAPTGPGRNITISGSLSYENLFLVNGVVITENLRGQPFDLFIEDAIEETTTSTSAVSAEYGRFGGGVINTITKSGGNELHGSFRTNFSNDDWQARNELSPEERTDEINETYEATLGGWLWRDKAWYFLAGRDLERVGTATTGRVQLFNGVFSEQVPFPEGREQKRYEGKLTLSPFQGHRITASYLEVDDLELGNRFIQNILDTKSINDRELPQELRALNYNGVLTDNFFVEAQYSEREFAFVGSGSSFTDRIGGTLFVDQPTGARWHSPTFCGVCRPEERDNDNLLLKASYFLTSESLGSHDIVVGYDTFTDIRAADNHQSGSDFRILLSGTVQQGGALFPVFLPEDDGDGTIIQWNPIFLSSKGTDFVTNSYFVNDRWRLNDKWSFNLGVRYDENDGRDAEGKQVASDSKISPRLALTWDPKGNGDWLFQAGYGSYVSAIASTQADSTSQGGNPATFQFWYRGPAINGPGQALVPADQALQQLWDWFDSVGGTANVNNPNLLRAQSIPGGTTVIGGGSLDSPHTTEYSLSSTKRLGAKGLIRADVVHREGHDFYVSRVDASTGQVPTPTGGRADLEVIQNDDSILERVYDGLHTQFQYRFTDRLNLGGNWTWSHVRGNWNGEIGVSGPVRSGVLNRPEYFDLAWNNPRGDLEIDTRHRVRLFGTYDVFRTEHHTLNVALLQNFASGQPYGANGPVNTRPFVTNPGYVTPPASVGYWFTNRDRFRTDDIMSTDIALNYSFLWGAFGKQFEVFVQPEVLNVFNDDGTELVNTSVFTRTNRSTSFCPGFAATCNAADRITLQAFNPFTEQPVEGVHWVKGPDFGKPTTEGSFQTARTFRFSVGIRF
jgi:hypothetical protein